MPKKSVLEEEKIARVAIDLFAEKGYAATRTAGKGRGPTKKNRRIPACHAVT